LRDGHIHRYDCNESAGHLQRNAFLILRITMIPLVAGEHHSLILGPVDSIPTARAINGSPGAILVNRHVIGRLPSRDFTIERNMSLFSGLFVWRDWKRRERAADAIEEAQVGAGWLGKPSTSRLPGATVVRAVAIISVPFQRLWKSRQPALAQHAH